MIKCFNNIIEKYSIDKNIHEEGKKEYLKNESVKSSSLQLKILFRNEGWIHFFCKNNNLKLIREKIEIEKRLNSIKIAKFIIKNFQFYQNKNIIYNNKKKITFYTFLGYHNGVRYLIILKKVKKQQLDFYSIIPNWEGCIPKKKKYTN